MASTLTYVLVIIVAIVFVFIAKHIKFSISLAGMLRLLAVAAFLLYLNMVESSAPLGTLGPSERITENQHGFPLLAFAKLRASVNPNDAENAPYLEGWIMYGERRLYSPEHVTGDIFCGLLLLGAYFLFEVILMNRFLASKKETAPCPPKQPTSS